MGHLLPLAKMNVKRYYYLATRWRLSDELNVNHKLPSNLQEEHIYEDTYRAQGELFTVNAQSEVKR